MTTILDKQNARVLDTAIDGEIVLMDLHTAEFLTLKGTAATVWRLIDGTRDRGAILAHLQHQFDGPPNRIAHELDAFLMQLRDAGFVS